ncbi:hypothetical protein MMAN_45800 [Mycobacterium mantenii]|uniref:Isochorismatase-like domain-containing protein n=2 Tax=Mycobacterium mantenii TaxID=560555 RepID=A0ABN6AG51_MYCNT|nr:hypothetical protein MMAN_45800 [Mycobacterium mantenii]
MLRWRMTRRRPGLPLIDPYNDFISPGGKVWDRLQGVIESNDCVTHMKQVLDAARGANLRVFYALHRRYRPGDYETWKYVAPVQRAAWSRKTFEYGTWGGEIRAGFEPRPGDIVAHNIEVPAVSPTPTWTCNSNAMGSSGSSSWV